MIETAMIFALGFLVASLCGLLVLPAVNARAARLARRRAEALVPLSPAEIAAERDFLRAQSAVRERRLERAVEATRAKRHGDMAAIGAGTMRIAALSRDVEERDTRIALAQARREALEADLAVARDEGSASLATLHALEEAQADLLDGLFAARHEARERASRQAAQDVSGAALAAERDDLRASLRAAEEALEAALEGTHSGASATRETGIERDNADLRRRIAEVADALIGQDRLPRAGAFAVAEPAPA